VVLFSALISGRRALPWFATWCLLTGLVFVCLPAPQRPRSSAVWVASLVPFTPSSFELLAAAARGDMVRIGQVADRLEPINTPLIMDEVKAWRLESRLADVARPSPGGLTALHLATYHGHRGTVRALLELGADPDALRSGDAGDSSGPTTALGIAAARNDEEMVRLLLDWEARVLPRRQAWNRLTANAAERDPSDARRWAAAPTVASLLAEALARESAADRMRDPLGAPAT